MLCLSRIVAKTVFILKAGGKQADLIIIEQRLLVDAADVGKLAGYDKPGFGGLGWIHIDDLACRKIDLYYMVTIP